MKGKLINAALLIASVIFSLVALEVGLRAYHGEWEYINFRNFRKALYHCLRWDQHAVGKGLVRGGDAEQGPERGVAGTAAVEAENEFIEVGLEMLAA